MQGLPGLVNFCRVCDAFPSVEETQGWDVQELGDVLFWLVLSCAFLQVQPCRPMCHDSTLLIKVLSNPYEIPFTTFSSKEEAALTAFSFT